MNHRMVLVIGIGFLSVLSLPTVGEVIYVDLHATGLDNGRSWVDAHISISSAIVRASAADEVWVAQGTYAPILLKSGVEVIGGFRGDEALRSASDPDAHKTYISGSGLERAVVSEGDDSSTLLYGFHIIRGYIAIPYMGAGMYLRNSDAMFVRCVFTQNRSSTLGGAVAIWAGSPQFVNCKFYNNDGGWAAGAVFSQRFAAPKFVNCLFYKNTAWEGGAVGIRNGPATFINCTIADNTATKRAGGALFDSGSSSRLYNSILWNNQAVAGGTHAIARTLSVNDVTTAAHCNIEGSWIGAGNTALDPLFVDPANGDYRLRTDSPCRDTGLDAHLPNDDADLNADGDRNEQLARDLLGNYRVHGSAVDMGAFEYVPSRD